MTEAVEQIFINLFGFTAVITVGCTVAVQWKQVRRVQVQAEVLPKNWARG